MGFNWRNLFGSVERKSSLASPDAALLELFGATPTAAGIAVSADTALRNPAVACATRLISEAAASLPLRVARVVGGEHQPDESHPVATFLRSDLNPWTSTFEGVRQLVVDTLSNDVGGMLWANKVNGKTIELIRYAPATLSVQFALDTGEPTYSLATTRSLDAADVVHVRNVSNRCPLTAAREAIGASILMERHASKLFANGARPSGVLSVKGTVSADAIEKIRTAFKLAHSGDRAGGTAVVGSDASYTPLTFKSTDAQFLELRQFQLAEISRAYRVPLPMLGDLSRATWSNSEQQGREFLSYCLEPWLLALESALNRALFTADERAAGYTVWFERDDLTRADLAARAVAYSSLVASRIFNPNEIRRWEGAAPYKGGDEFANPNITPKVPA